MKETVSGRYGGVGLVISGGKQRTEQQSKGEAGAPTSEGGLRPAGRGAVYAHPTSRSSNGFDEGDLLEVLLLLQEGRVEVSRVMYYECKNSVRTKQGRLSA